MKQSLLVSLALPLLLSLVACVADTGTGGSPGTGVDDPDGGPAAVACTPANIEQTLLARKCAGCHSGASAPKGVNLALAGVADRVAQQTSSCLNKKLVVPGDPTASFLLEKLSANPSCGVRMPKDKPELTAEEKNCVADWI